MEKRNVIRAISISILIYIVLLASCAGFLFISETTNFKKSSSMVSSQIAGFIVENDEEKNNLQESLKLEYISRAKSLAYILENSTGLQEDYDELCRVAEVLDVDEINLFGLDGDIKYSTVPDYVGFSIYSGGQIEFFEQMMDNYSLELCQDLTRNTKDGKLIMYAAVWESSHQYLVQIGISPDHLLESLKENDISNVLDKIPVEESLYIIYDDTIDSVVSSTDKTLLNLKNSEIAFNFESEKDRPLNIKYNGDRYIYCIFDYEDYRIAICEERNYVFYNTRLSLAFLSMLLAAILVVSDIIVLYLIKRKNKVEEEHFNELQSFSNKLSSYKQSILSDALIILEINLNKDCLYYGVWKDDDGKVVPLKEILGIEVPCSYDIYIKLWNDHFVRKNVVDSFSDYTNRNFLIDEFKNGKNEITFDYEAKTISGKSTWLRRSIAMVEEPNGDVIAYTSVKNISSLIDKQKREESYIRALSNDYESIAVVDIFQNKEEDKILLHSSVSDEITKIVGTNVLDEQYFSKRLDLLGKFVHEEDKEYFFNKTRREAIFESFKQDKIHSVDFRLMLNDKDYVYYQERFIPLKNDDNQINGVIACLRNRDEEVRKELSIRKELEDAKFEAEASNRSKSTFLFNMSHDIRTPMNAIIGFTDIASKHFDDKERLTSALKNVKMASDHLLSLINDVLDMSRVESGTVKISEEVTNIDTVIDNLHSILAGTAQAKNISFTSIIDSSLIHHWVYADRLRVMRVLTNIVSNSIKYTNPNGTIEIKLEELPSDDSNYAKLRYTVKDTGIGMSEEFLAHIFEPFSRAESATKSGIQGTGLGMAITKSLIELMGGTIDIESELGKGTTVIIDFSNRISESVSVAQIVDELSDIGLAGKKILLVEDNELNREIAVEILEEEGIIVDTAEDGDIALEKIKNANDGDYDVVLMDIQMPRMNGYEATKEIRNLPSQFAKNIPIIAMTANAFEEDKQNAFNAGMNGHVAKPIDVSILLETLSNILIVKK